MKKRKKKIVKEVFGTPREIFGMPKKTKAPSYRRMFRDARRTLEEKRGRGPRDALMQRQSKAEYAQLVREVAREALLREHVSERRCALCGGLKLRSRQWVFLSESQAYELCRQTGKGLATICKSCFQRHVSRRHG